MKIAILINTYMRSDGNTPKLLRRALDSVFAQTHKDFKIFVIGDHYENENEFIEICETYESEKIYYENLETSERDNYAGNSLAIWSYGGCNAKNTSIEKALNEEYSYMCNLDHDDFWDPTHLEEICKAHESTGATFLCTKSTYIGGKILPRHEGGDLIDFLPEPGNLVHSSTCINFKEIPLKYVDLFKETGNVSDPGDAYMWKIMSEYMSQKGLKGVLINKVTCYKEDEGYERK
jgi:glycosyltransferase involved in cell wall biosynthesis